MCTASSLFQRNPTPPHTMCEGTRVSTYLALTFGTLLSSQRTDASITTLTGRSGRFPLGFHYFSGFPRPLLIGVVVLIFGAPKTNPVGEITGSVWSHPMGFPGSKAVVSAYRLQRLGLR